MRGRFAVFQMKGEHVDDPFLDIDQQDYFFCGFINEIATRITIDFRHFVIMSPKMKIRCDVHVEFIQIEAWVGFSGCGFRERDTDHSRKHLFSTAVSS